MAGPDVTNDAALRKRQQIQKANRTMFIWVAGASLIIGICGVGAYFLFQKVLFGERVLMEKAKTEITLRDNIGAADELLAQIRVLNTNAALRRVTLSDSQNPVETVLDALPAGANSSALAASLQEKLLNGDGVTLESLSVVPVVGVETGDEISTSGAEVEEGQIGFSFEVSATNANALKSMLQRLERSIRTIKLTNIELETESNQYTLSGQGVAYYQPKIESILKEVTVK